MRIISGIHRGRKIVLPKDTKTIRPTSDFVREAVFNMLTHGRFNDYVNVVQGAVVADICAGSGALGLEALSRGAEHVTLVDSSREALDVIRHNVAHFKEESRVDVISADASKLPPARRQYNLVLMDPPYHQGLIPQILQSLVTQQWLADGAIIIAEHDAKEVQSLPEGFKQADQRSYGRTTLDVLRYAPTASTAMTSGI